MFGIKGGGRVVMMMGVDGVAGWLFGWVAGLERKIKLVAEKVIGVEYTLMVSATAAAVVHDVQLLEKLQLKLLW